MGTCNISYDGVDLGLTMGGVEVDVTTSTHETKVDQYGDTIANEFIMGRMIAVKVPLAETTLENMEKIMPGATLTTDGVKASGTVTVSAVPIADESVTVNGVEMVFKAVADVTADQINLAADASAQAVAIAGAINSSSTAALLLISATVDGAVVTVSYNDYGPTGNAVTLVDGTTGDVAVSGATLSGGVVATASKVAVTSGVGISLLDSAKELILHPVENVGDTSEDLIIPLAATPGGINFAYKHDQERVYMADFKGYPDATQSGLLFIYGDKTATG
tara:strand:+ start:4827 stop:5657 length:831 start_codon:yes stop_codon:yes gene_type:complete